MTRILTYNILLGGTQRVDQLTEVIRSTHPDVVGLIEATNPQVIEELAERLGMRFCLSGQAKHEMDWQVGILSHLPIVHTKTHKRPGILTKQHLLEVCVEEPNGNQLTVFVVHLTAQFYKGLASNTIRRSEVQELLRIMASKQGQPHLLMGDFNSIAPGERLQGSSLLRYIIELDHYYRQNPDTFVKHPDLDYVVPPPLRFFNRFLQAIPRNKLLCALMDAASFLYAPRASIGLLHRAGYVDCFRHTNPRSPGFTYSSTAPSGRIDFIFASLDLAQRLSACYIVEGDKVVYVSAASDHLPVLAEFSEAVERQKEGGKDVLKEDESSLSFRPLWMCKTQPNYKRPDVTSTGRLILQKYLYIPQPC
jgi:endonuclease/exonuclease/phosphatase family metal-dependent hydrolase